MRRQGQAAAALAQFDPLAPVLEQSWGLHFERGMALAALGRAGEAAIALRQAVTLNPRSPLARHALADQLVLAGHADEARAARAPRLPGGIDDSALVECVVGSCDGATEDTERLRVHYGLARCDVAALRLLSEAALAGGREAAAADFLAHALTLAPDFHAARYHLAILLHRSDRGPEALAAVTPLVEALPEVSGVQALVAAIHMQCGAERRAIEAYEAALALQPEGAAVWLGYGHALRACGRQAEAVVAYRRALERAPARTEPYWSLANLKTWRFDPADIGRMEALLARDDLPAGERAHLHFALAKAREDEEAFEAAFRHYRAGNRLRRAENPYDMAAHEALVRRTIETFDADFLAAREGGGDPSPDPIFVLGLPRAGSTLVEQILASHSAVEGASELPDLTAIARSLAREGTYPESLRALPPARFAELGVEYLARTRSRRPLGRPFFVDKFPGNMLHVGLIHLILPHARIIDVRRHPVACAVSLFRQNFARGQGYSYDLADLGRYIRSYEALMAHFARVLPGRILRVSYEALVEDVEGETRRLLAHCGLPFEPSCLRFFENDRAVRTPSSEQVRRPIFREGLSQWRHFAPWLGELVEALGPWADEHPVMGDAIIE